MDRKRCSEVIFSTGAGIPVIAIMCAEQIQIRMSYCNIYIACCLLQEMLNTSETSVNLTRLMPFTNYTFSISCLVANATRGYWSDEKGTPAPVASTRVQGWGGTKRGRGVWGGGSAPPQKIFCFVISKWHILVNSEVVNLKFFLLCPSFIFLHIFAQLHICIFCVLLCYAVGGQL